jgi:6-phospho-beta-glucosidase
MKIAILGAAGVRTPLMLQAIANHQEALGITELSLMDIDAAHLELIATVTAPLESSGRFHFKIQRTTDARTALQAADYVITTFRVGDMSARVVDERVPLAYGILGQETTGPGGFAMAMRTIPVLLDYIQIMREVCPQAWLINFANPAGLLAETIIRAAGWTRAVGICDSPTQIQRAAAGLLGLPVSETYMDYFGLNHLGWMRGLRCGQQDLLPAMLAEIRKTGSVPMLPFSAGLVGSLGMIPNEYLYYYYNTRGAVENILKAGQTRGEQLVALNECLFTDLAAARDPSASQACYQAYLAERHGSYMARETGHGHSAQELALSGVQADEGYAGVALGLIEALHGGTPRVMILNVPNQGAMRAMSDTDVVEIPTYVGKGSLQPLAVGDAPDHCLALMKQVKVYERLTIEAASKHSRAAALHALTVHPLLADASLAEKILAGYQAQHASLFPELN